jgi:hypothetical protein
MTRFRNFLWVAVMTSAMLFSLRATARANDEDRNYYGDRYEQRENRRGCWRDRDGRSFRRVWDPNRGWVVERYFPPRSQWEHHDNGRHLGSYKHEGREGHDRDDD